MKAPLVRISVGALFFLAVWQAGNLSAQSSSGEPDADPTGNAGVLKSNVATGCGYDARTGNASRSITDLSVPGALGVYGLEFTRHWNSIPSEGGDTCFVNTGWTHSWRWSATQGVDVVQAYDGGPQSWITSITIDFPDGRSTKYSIYRGSNSVNAWGPPYSPAEASWGDPGTVRDHVGGMASNGSNFWLYLADGGSVHFTNGPDDYRATEVFDPHGYRTDLRYDANGHLDQVKQETGGRFLSIEWVYKQVNSSGGIPAIGAVQTGGPAGTQRVEYNYSGYTVTEGRSSYTWYAFTDVKYVNDPFPGQERHSSYAYHTFTGLTGLDGVGPALEYADDKRFAGPMTKIRYTYRGSACHKTDKPQFEPYTNARFDYYYATANSITAELSGETGETVSSLALGCFTGIRTETSGLGGWRKLYFGRSAGGDPGAQFIGDLQTGHWNPPEAGQGNYQGYHLTKVTDFYAAATPDNVPFDFQHYYQDYPWRLFDGYGNITQVSMVQGQWGLEASGRVAEVWHRADNSKHTYNWTDPGSSAPRDTSRIPTTYSHWLFSETDEGHFTTTYRRDARRRVTDIYHADGSSEHFTYNDAFNKVETHTLPSGAIQHYQYDGSGSLYQEWNDVDGPGAARIYTYDSYGRVATVSDGRSLSAGAPYSTWMEYNGRNQITKVHYAPTGAGSDPTVTYGYDDYGNCTSITDELGHTSVYEYDSYRRCKSYTEQINAPGLDGTTNVPSRRWDWIYDRSIDGIGFRGAYTHTANEWCVQVEPAFNASGERRMTARWHDLQNRIVMEQTGWVQPPGSFPNNPPNWYWSADGETHNFGYDVNGNKNWYRDPRGRDTTYEYDNRNRLWKTIEPLNRVTETNYDASGNKNWIRSPDMTTQQWFNYDRFGQPRQFMDERGNLTDLNYWPWGPMKKLAQVITHRVKDGGGWENQLTGFYYDLRGRPQTTMFPDGSSESSDYEFGQPKHSRTRKNQTKTRYYDARGRESSHTWSDGTPGITRQWDAASRLTSISNIFSSIDYAYDDAAQVKWEGDTVAGGGPRVQTTYRRYGDGNVAYIQYPDGLWVNRQYTARGQLRDVWDSFVGWQRAIGYTYLPDGKVDHADYQNGVRTVFAYDGRGMPRIVEHFRISPYQNYSWREYWRDERDRITAFQKSTNNSVNPMENGRGDRFRYDEEGQLVEAWYNAANPAASGDGYTRYDGLGHYDALGNRYDWEYISSRGWMNFTRKDNGLNQYRTWLNNIGTSYDDDIGGTWGAPQAANGVLMQEGNITAGYNALNQPTMMQGPPLAGSQTWIFFGYDPLGRCVRRWTGQLVNGNPPLPSVSTGGTFFYYDGWNLIEENTGAGSASRNYIHGARLDEIVKQLIQYNPAPRYFHYDARGHCTLQTDASGNIAEQYEYDAFGYPYFYNASGTNIGYSPWGNRFLFTGREWFSDLKLYDYRARLYQPELGRFLQPDPKQFAAGDYNLYRYCHNDPVNKSDPTGLYFTIAGGDRDWLRKTAADLKKNERDLVRAAKDGVKGAGQALKDFRALKNDKNYEVKIVPAGQTRYGMNGYSPSQKTIGYEAYKANTATARDADGSVNRDASVGLGHEVGHAVDDYFGRLSSGPANDPGRFPNRGEETAVEFENIIRSGRWPDDPGRQRPQF